MSSTKFVFLGRSEKQDGRPGLWLAETFSTSPLKRLNGIQRNLTGSKIPTPSTKFVFFELIRKTRWPPWPLIGWDIFNFSSENRWTEFNEFWQEARSQRPLLSLCFLGWSEKQDGRPGLWLAETFSTPLKPLNGIQRNMRGSKISTSSTKFVFFGPIRKTRWPPWRLIGWDIFDFSSETAERNSAKYDRKQDHNVLCQVWVFRADRKNKMATLDSNWLRHFQLLWNHWTEFNETWQKARSQCFYLPNLCFRVIQKWRSWSFCKKGGTLYSGARYVALWTSCLCIYLGEGRGRGRGGALMHLYVWEHIVIPNYRTPWRMFTKLVRDEELMVPHMH